MTLSILFSECYYAERRNLCNVMLSVILLSVILLSVIMLSVIMPSLIMLSVIMLSVIMLIVIMLSIIMLSVIMLSVIMLSVIMLSVTMLSVIMLSVIMVNAVMLSVMAQSTQLFGQESIDQQVFLDCMCRSNVCRTISFRPKCVDPMFLIYLTKIKHRRMQYNACAANVHSMLMSAIWCHDN
jgi:hypothetical protein